MNGYEFIATLIKSLAWPLVALVVLHSFRIQIAALVGKISSFKASKDGIEFETMGEISKEVIGKEPSPEIEHQLEKKQILEKGVNANGSYKLYANGVIVARKKVTLSPGQSSHNLTLPVAMVNEVTGVQFIGDIRAKVMASSQAAVAIEFDPSNVERTIEVVVTGL